MIRPNDTKHLYEVPQLKPFTIKGWSHRFEISNSASKIKKIHNFNIVTHLHGPFMMACRIISYRIITGSFVKSHRDTWRKDAASRTVKEWFLTRYNASGKALRKGWSLMMFPKPSMYGMFTYIYLFVMVKYGKCR